MFICVLSTTGENILKALFKPAGLLGLVLLISACAGDTVIMTPLTPKSQLTNEQGVVVATVIDAGGYPLPFNQLTFTPDNVNESKKIKPIRLQSKKSLRTGTTIFAAPIKSGTYAISSIRSFYSTGEYWYSKFVSADATMGTFEVKPGQVTDLGTLIYYPKPDGDKYKDTLSRVPSYTTNLGETLSKEFPFYDFDKEQVLTWQEDERDEQRGATYASIAQNPISFEDRYLAPDNTIYFLSQLGVILSMDEAGEFNLDAVDTNSAIVKMAQNGQGEKVLADALGQLFIQNLDREWSTLDLETGEFVHDLTFTQDDQLQILSSKQGELYIHSYNTLNNELSLLNQFSRSKGWNRSEKPAVVKEKRGVYDSQGSSIYDRTSKKNKQKKDKMITNASLYKMAGKNYLSIQQTHMSSQIAFGGGDITVYEYQPSDWMVQGMPADVDIHATANAGVKSLGVERAGFWSWSGSPTYYTFSDKEDIKEIKPKAYACKNGTLTTKYNCSVKTGKGKNNDKTIVRNRGTRFSFSSVPVFIDENTAITVAKVSGAEFKLEDDTMPQILKTIDGGQHWTLTGNTPPKNYCSALIPQVKGKLVISCNGATGDFYESYDEGKT